MVDTAARPNKTNAALLRARLCVDCANEDPDLMNA
jgi:hypothetical protein